MPDAVVAPTAYETLGVHPSAPGELISAVYWTIVDDLQRKRASGQHLDARLYAVTHAYEAVADPNHRAIYDESIGFKREPLITRPMPGTRRSLRSRLFRRRPDITAPPDYAEVLGLNETAPKRCAHEAYRIMREHYQGVPDRRRRQRLLNLLDEAYRLMTSDVGSSEDEPTLDSGKDARQARDPASPTGQGARAISEDTSSEDAPMPPSTEDVGRAKSSVGSAGRGVRAIARKLTSSARRLGRVLIPGSNGSHRVPIDAGARESPEAPPTDGPDTSAEVVDPSAGHSAGFEERVLDRIASTVAETGETRPRPESGP